MPHVVQVRTVSDALLVGGQRGVHVILVAVPTDDRGGEQGSVDGQAGMALRWRDGLEILQCGPQPTMRYGGNRAAAHVADREATRQCDDAAPPGVALKVGPQGVWITG
ncbi:MAG: hypothetical protein ACRDTG_02935 [Pseudonocardiaceae bacterium]